MLKLNLNESNYNEVMREIENKQDIDTTFRTYTTLTTYHGKKYPVYSIYVEYRDVSQDLHSYNYQWVLAGYTDNGVLYLTADEINDYNLSSYMDGEVITNLKGMIRDYPEAFYIEDVITENLNEDTFSDVNYILSMFEDDDNLDKLYDIADRYNTSSPVSGNWDTETKHQQKTIAKEFNISLEDAKDVMINILGFDDEMFNENKSFKNGKRYTKQFNETAYTKNSFKIGDKVCSKLTSKNPANVKFCGTIIDINRNGLCTVECADGTVIDGIRQDRLVCNRASKGI